MIPIHIAKIKSDLSESEIRSYLIGEEHGE